MSENQEVGRSLRDGLSPSVEPVSAVSPAVAASIPSAGRCECERCQYGREVERHLAMLTDDVRPFFEDMNERLFYTQNDLDHANVILDGSWPSAVPQLQRALAEAWRIAREQGYDRDWDASGIAARSDETAEQAQPEGQEPARTPKEDPALRSLAKEEG